jgi:hypothetical protein
LDLLKSPDLNSRILSATGFDQEKKMSEEKAAMPQNTWGGRRAGAGRPRSEPGTRKASRSISLPALTWHRVDAIGMGRSRFVELAVERALLHHSEREESPD